MRLEAPPSRYRVVERGGRLVVIDTVAGGTPLKARELVPAAMDEQPLEPTPASDHQVEPAREILLQTLASRPTGYTPSRSPIAQPPGLLRNVAATVCSDAHDGDGRLQWTTAPWFDARGPRTVSLTERTEQQLGLATLALLAGAVVAIIAAIGFGFVGIVILIVAASSLPKAKPAVTSWIDKLVQV